MSQHNNILQKIAFCGARVTAFLLAIGSAIGAIKIAIDMPPEMDSGLRWGLFGMMVVMCVNRCYSSGFSMLNSHPDIDPRDSV